MRVVPNEVTLEACLREQAPRPKRVLKPNRLFACIHPRVYCALCADPLQSHKYGYALLPPPPSGTEGGWLLLWEAAVAALRAASLPAIRPAGMGQGQGLRELRQEGAAPSSPPSPRIPVLIDRV